MVGIEDKLLSSFIYDARWHFTHSEKVLLLRMIPEICMKDEIGLQPLLENRTLKRLLYSKLDPVQKGRKIFQLIRKMRYPLSEGKREVFEKLAGLKFSPSLQISSGVSVLDSRKKLINPYYYGAGVFDLKEHVISLIRSCPLDCAYCFLREVYDDSRFKVPPNFHQMDLEMNDLRNKTAGPLYLNAGENADSLILDLEYGLAAKLWQIVQPVPDTFLELRSKTNKIQRLIRIVHHQKRIVAAFSLNPEEDRALFESNTATMEQRISAISELQKCGFMIGLRFEPIVYTKNYKQKYAQLFESVFSVIRPRQIHSIALGCMRLTKELFKLLHKSHPRLLAEEWVLGMDKKFRYYKGIRTEIYQNLIELLDPYFSMKERIVLSTEPVEIWRAAGLTLKTMPEICSLP